MSTVISCSLLSGRPAAAPSRSSGNRAPPTGKAAAVALSCFQRQSSRPSSVCCASNPKGDHHVPKSDLPPFGISPVALLHPHPGSPQGDRWGIQEWAKTVTIWFEVPGLSQDDLVVELDEDVLVIRKMKAATATTEVGGSGSSKDATGAAADDGDIDMYARLLVPAGYNKETVRAELASGVLKVHIDKVKECARRRISVEIKVK